MKLDCIDLSGLDPRLQRVPIHAAVNPGNRLLGPRGVARVHGPQAGMDALDAIADRRKLARQGDWTSHYEVRDAEAAISSTRRLLRLARIGCDRIFAAQLDAVK